MRTKKEVVRKDPLTEAISAIQNSITPGLMTNKRKIVDIITFCDDPQYLDLPASYLKLWMPQKVILKTFYMGTRGNENLKLTQEECEWLYANKDNEERDGIIFEKNLGEVIEKLVRKEKENFNFTELHLCVGRRGTKCRSEDDLIATTEGSLTFRELCDRLNIGEKIGICTYNKDTLKRSITYGVRAQDNGVVNCFEVETKRGIKETSSWNHPYLIWRDDSPKFIQMTDIRVGDKIAVSACTEIFGKGGIGVNRAALLGYLQAGTAVGCLRSHDIDRKNNISIMTKAMELELLIATDIKRLIEIEFPDYNIAEWIEGTGGLGDKGEEKVIPECIYRATKEEVVSYLSRLFSSSRYVIGNDEVNSRFYISYFSESKNMVDGVRHLLQKFGIHSIVVSKIIDVNGKKISLYEVRIEDGEYIEKFEKEINIFSKEKYVRRIVDLSLVASGHSKDEFLSSLGSSDVKWDEVKSVKCVGEKKTVDLEVADTHIIGGDIISHNTVLASIISAYEAYKLLCIGDGDPHKFYGIPKGEDVHIINVALSLEQAGTLFGMIRQRFIDAPFFRDRIANATTTEIRLYTDEDIRKKNSKKGNALEIKGSIVILCGHSNPDTLRGKSAVLILFDELAFYDEAGKTPGSEFYNALEPSIKKFKKFGDARLVEISSPNSTVGIFYDLFRQAKTTRHILSYQMPTWCVNYDIPYESLEDERKRNVDNFTREFGAQWSKSGIYGNYFDTGLVDRCIRPDLYPHTRPQPGFNYYIHVDPANGGDRYVAVMVAKQMYTNHIGKRRPRAFLANIWVWEPVPGVGLMFNQIDQQMIQICKIFHPMCVSYDQWNSIHSLQLLRSHGVRTMETSYNRSFKAKIYLNLKELMTYQPQPELWLYNDARLILEMKSIKVRPTMRGQSVMPDKHGEVKTDDLVDCLAGATSMATDAVQAPLPEPMVVYMPNWR